MSGPVSSTPPSAATSSGSNQRWAPQLHLAQRSGSTFPERRPNYSFHRDLLAVGGPAGRGEGRRSGGVSLSSQVSARDGRDACRSIADRLSGRWDST